MVATAAVTQQALGVVGFGAWANHDEFVAAFKASLTTFSEATRATYVRQVRGFLAAGMSLQQLAASTPEERRAFVQQLYPHMSHREVVDYCFGLKRAARFASGAALG